MEINKFKFTMIQYILKIKIYIMGSFKNDVSFFRIFQIGKKTILFLKMGKSPTRSSQPC